MTPTTSLTLDFADGEYLFDLRLPQLAELQEKRGPVFKVYARVRRGRYILDDEVIGLVDEAEAFSDDLFETIRLGLIGGGEGVVNGAPIKVTPLTAKALVERYCHAAPLRDSWNTAAAILAARIEGYTPPKKVEPAKKPATKTSRSTSRKSSPTAPSSEPTGGN